MDHHCDDPSCRFCADPSLNAAAPYLSEDDPIVVDPNAPRAPARPTFGDWIESYRAEWKQRHPMHGGVTFPTLYGESDLRQAFDAGRAALDPHPECQALGCAMTRDDDPSAPAETRGAANG